jgi:hypothetical protein
LIIINVNGLVNVKTANAFGSKGIAMDCNHFPCGEMGRANIPQ